jgi:hypothetical protein
MGVALMWRVAVHIGLGKARSATPGPLLACILQTRSTLFQHQARVTLCMAMGSEGPDTPERHRSAAQIVHLAIWPFMLDEGPLAKLSRCTAPSDTHPDPQQQSQVPVTSRAEAVHRKLKWCLGFTARQLSRPVERPYFLHSLQRGEAWGWLCYLQQPPRPLV